jgi:hypothetical protein
MIGKLFVRVRDVGCHMEPPFNFYCTRNSELNGAFEQFAFEPENLDAKRRKELLHIRAWLLRQQKRKINVVFGMCVNR